MGTLQDFLSFRFLRQSLEASHRVHFFQEVNREPSPTQSGLLTPQTMETALPHQLMIVDDSEFMRRFLSKFLGKKLQITVVSDGVEALQKLQNGYRPDVVLADINMPNMNGFEFLEHMQASPLYQSVPVIMLSSNDDSNDRIKSLRLGAVDYIVKPFNPIELELRVDAQIQRAFTK